MESLAQIKHRIIMQSDICVKCGMCSSQCPTYISKQDENESPRGRIALAQAFANKTTDNLTLITQHIDSCLGCMRCEKICPSKVPYREILDNTKQLIHQLTDKKYRIIKLLSRIDYSQWKKLGRITRITQQARISQLLSLVFANRYRNYLRPVARLPKPKQYKHSVQLFVGCLSNIFDQTTLASLIKLLDACEISAQIPEKQTCCGALAMHKGLLAVAENCRISNETTFKSDSPILFSTSGCGAHLKATTKSDSFSVFKQLEEAGQFFLNNEKFKQLSFAPLFKKVLIHSPCSEKNVLKKSTSALLLDRIPQIQLSALPETTTCCGASGSFMLEHPIESERIRQQSLNAIVDSNPDILVSTNYPCAMHLAAGLKQKDLDIKVMHPIVLLQQQLIK